MLRELVQAAERFRQEGELQPAFYKAKVPVWVVVIEGKQGHLEGPFRRGDIRPVLAPDRQRSGKIGAENLKPYLLMDDARYVLGIPEPGRIEEAHLAHRSFVELVEEAATVTGDPNVLAVAEFLRYGALSAGMRERIRPRDMVTFRVGSVFPCEKPEVQEFWARYLARELEADFYAECSVCGSRVNLLRTLPKEVFIMGQKCQITSFNLSAFESFGKKQTTNAALCVDCAARFIQAIDHMTTAPKHRSVLMRDESRGRGTNPLRNQLALFWLKQRVPRVVEGRKYDLEELICSGLLRQLNDRELSQGPPPELTQLEAALMVPWKPEETALNLREDAFYLVVLSANKGRLVIREWITGSLERLLDSLRRYQASIRIVAPDGMRSFALPVPVLIRALGTGDPNVVRGFLRTAFQGYPPPRQLLGVTVSRLINPKVWGTNDTGRPQLLLHPLISVLKLAFLYGKEEEVIERMEHLDIGRDETAYLCGRLLAVLEEIQRRASGKQALGRTLVERCLGAALTAPAATFGRLVPLAEEVYLRKLRNERRGYSQMSEMLRGIIGRIGPGKFPRTLKPEERAEFLLGLYHQRAAFALGRREAGN